MRTDKGTDGGEEPSMEFTLYDQLALIDIKNTLGEKMASPTSSAGKTESKASHWVRKISTSCVIDTGLIFKQTEATLSQSGRGIQAGHTYRRMFMVIVFIIAWKRK